MGRRSGPSEIAEQLAIRKQQMDEQHQSTQEGQAAQDLSLKGAEFNYRQAHDESQMEMDRRVHALDAMVKMSNMAKESYEMNQKARVVHDVTGFYTLLKDVDRDSPTAANDIAKLKAAFPLATQDEGVRATLSNDYSDVLSHRGVSREDREANEKRDFLMKYNAAAAKDDEFRTNNPELSQIHDLYAKDLLQYENGKRAKSAAASGQPDAPVTQPLSVKSLFAKPNQPAVQPAAPEAAAPAPASAPEAAPSAAPVSGKPLALVEPAVPPASTPKAQQIDQWSSASPMIAQDGGALDINLPDSGAKAGDVYKILQGQPAPTPTPTPTGAV